METAVQPSLVTKIIVNIVFWGAIFSAMILGILWLAEHDRARERGWKQDCLDRGGSVIEHIGGALGPRFDCINPKSFK